MTTPTINFSLSAICQQRQKQMAFHTPPPRFNLFSPYNGTYTQKQLDMRRKGEILKYKNNASSSKTNEPTRSQKWNQLVKGYSNTQKGGYSTVNYTIIDHEENYQTISIQYPNTLTKVETTKYILDENGNLTYNYLGKPVINTDAYRIVGLNGYYNIYININDANLNCAQDDLIPTPTSSSNIPGPIEYLINDETVPLYNYQTKTQAFSYDTTNANTDKWMFNPDTNVLLQNGEFKNLFSLMITQLIDQASYTFSLNIPFSIFISGTDIFPAVIEDPSNNILYFPNLALGIESLKFGVSYAGNEVLFRNPPSINIQTNNRTINLTNNDGVYNVPINSNLYPLQFDVSFSTPPTQTTDSYYANIYSGIINISNILLLTEPGYVYDFFLKINASNMVFASSNQEFFYNSTIQNTNYGFFVNTTPASNVANNCVTYPYSNTQVIQKIKLSGT